MPHLTAFLTLLLTVNVAVGGEGGELLKQAAGPYAVRTVEAVTVTDPVRDTDVTLRILHPDAEGTFPLVVFSSGAFCFPQMYDLVTGHWASHGYIVVVPNHIDSPNNENKPTPDTYDKFFPLRARDLTFVVEEIDAIQAAADMRAVADPERVASAGHSFGALIALIKVGMGLKPEFRDSWADTYDERFRAAVVLSAPGPGMPEIAENGYVEIRKPFMTTGGTKDVGRVDPGEYTPAEWRTLAYTLGPPGDKYAVITEGSDHYMGGLICNPDRGDEPDHAGVQTVAAMTTNFLDAYLKQDKQAKEYLQTADLDALTGGQARNMHK